MFRKQFAVQAASLCGFLAAATMFLMGLSLTIGFTRWDPYMRVDWQQFLAVPSQKKQATPGAHGGRAGDSPGP